MEDFGNLTTLHLWEYYIAKYQAILVYFSEYPGKEQEVQKLMSNLLDKPLVNRSREGADPPPPEIMMPEDHLGNLLQRGPDRLDRSEPGKVHPAVDHSQEPRSLTEVILCLINE